MSERLNKTSVCTVIFVGIVDYAQMPVDSQIALKERFNALISEAVAQIAQNDRIILDTGEGAAIALMGAPEDALTVALNIRDGVLRDRAHYPERAISVRIGINLGPVRVVNDLNERLNVVGDGINAAQRVMSFAQPDRILVSRSYYEIASRLSSELAGMFRYLGVKTDKFVREHEVYSVLDGDEDLSAPVPEDSAVSAAVQPSTDRVGALKIYALPVLAAVVAVAIAWGYWVSRPPASEAMPETATGTDAARPVAQEAGNDAQAQARKENKKSKPKNKSSEPAQTAARAAPEPASSTDTAADARPSSETASQPSEPERNPLCSDAQRMLKQC